MNRAGMSLAALAVVCASVLYGCADGDEAVINITSTSAGGGSGGSANPMSTCPSFATARPQDDDGNDVCGVASVILEDQTWTADTIWYLPGRVTVGNGNQLMSAVPGTLENGNPVDSAVLTIEPGTEIKGATNSFANLIITRGSRIEARGTATDPIVFSSDDDGYEGSGEWGGLVIQGYAPNNKCPASACNINSELLSGRYGGDDPADTSGTLRYVIVAEGGYEFDLDEEINGISFEAVGAGTEVEFIQVHGNADDGVEFFGGTVNAKYVVLTDNQDDSVDWDEGFQGYMQHVLVIQPDNAGGSNYGIEADTTGTLDFYSLPVIANATYIGNGSGRSLLNFKATTGGYLVHSVFTWDDAITDATNCIDPSTFSGAAVPDLLDVQTEVADCTNPGNSDLFQVVIGDVELNEFFAATTADVAADVGALQAVFDDFPTDHPTAFGIPDGTLQPERPPATGSAGFFDNTDYAGAVDPAITDEEDLWYAGWTLEGTVLAAP